MLAWLLGRRTGGRLVAVRAELNSTLVDSLQGMANLLAFGAEGRMLARAETLSRSLGNLQVRMGRITGLHTALAGLLMNLATLAVTAAAIGLVSDGVLDGVYLALLALATIASFEATIPLPQAFQELANSLEAGRRFFEIVDAEPAVTDPPKTVPISAPEACCLHAQTLTFAYKPGAGAALKGIDFSLPAGRCLAVVGPSGGGKTTLVRLLLRFWDVDPGQLLLGTRPIGDYAQEEVRHLFAVVSQDTHLFNATVRENLLLARPDAHEADMIKAARQARIHDFVMSLPEGYDTWIGEQGLRLSGGQRQRLAIARAILQDAPILLLDEPTANLDALTEQGVMAALRPLMARRTTLIITHRLVGLDAADEILVLQAGEVVERGRHGELLAREGFYRRMWWSQAQALDLPVSRPVAGLAGYDQLTPSDCFP